MKKQKNQIKYILKDDVGLSLLRGKLLLDYCGKMNILQINKTTENLIKQNAKFFDKSDLMLNKDFYKIIKHHLIKIPENSWLEKYLGTKYEKTALYFFMNGFKLDAIKELSKKKVVIIGIGGIGALILHHFFAVGITNIVAIDFDKISADNLNRQYLFSEKDIGKSKLSVIKKNYKIETIDKQIKSSEDFEKIIATHSDADIVINCADTPQIHIEKFLLEPLLSKKMAFTTCGVGLKSGAVGPLLVSMRQKCKYFKTLLKISNALDYSSVCKSSFGPTNSLIADILAKEVCFYLLGLPVGFKNKRLEFSFDYKFGVKEYAF
jgi:hypothetical protein